MEDENIFDVQESFLDSEKIIANSDESIKSPEEITEDSKPTEVVSVNPESGESISLNVDALNMMAESYLESSLAVSQGTNDYFDFIPTDVKNYFQGIMENKPFNNYVAYHLRHWIQNTQYYSYYDDYYYLYPDIDNSNDYIEVVKYNGQSNYVINYGSASPHNATILYGSEDGQSDLRGGNSYVLSLASVCVLGCVCVLYIVNAIFRHLRS